ncbi:hypothetical protein BMS3Abin17_01076 [archaeon BMS3Abin17]|nr:hypothetical protein BMS3Abin17_01076 [archaeon BMS3Abin17]
MTGLQAPKNRKRMLDAMPEKDRANIEKDHRISLSKRGDVGEE